MVRWLLLATMAAGVALVGYSWRMPAYTDPAAKAEWDARGADFCSGRHDMSGSEDFDKQYLQAVAALRTSRMDLMNVALSVASLSLALLIASLRKGIKSFADIANITTPDGKQRLKRIGYLSWLSLIPGAVILFWFQCERGDYPGWADSPGIYIFSQAIMVFLGLPFMAGFFALCTNKGQYPAKLFSRFPTPSTKATAWELLICVLCLADLYVLGTSFWQGDFITVPVSFFLLYVLLSSRAGLVAKQMLNTTPLPPAEPEEPPPVH